jgi:hypothetical protein
MHGPPHAGLRGLEQRSNVGNRSNFGALAPRSSKVETDHDNRRARRRGFAILGIPLTVCASVVLAAVSPRPGHARDDGRYAGSNPELKSWFDSLRSAKGPCCSDADGTALSDVDWESKGGHYRVRLDGVWVDVPDDAVITVPNRVGRTMVWPMYHNGEPTPRCFMPGSMT